MGGRGASSASAAVAAKPPQTDHLSSAQIPKTPAETAAYLGVSEERAKELYGSIQSFTGSGYTEIRKAQNGGGSDWAKKAAENCEAYIDAAPKWGGGTTYRGINVSKEAAATFVKNAIIDINRGTASWSTSREVSKSFSGKGSGSKVVFRCKTQSRGTSIKHISFFPGENEVLVSRRVQYKVTGRRQQGSYLYVDVEEV